MLLALRLVLSRLRSPSRAPTVDGPPRGSAEALWLEARAERSPFRRDALHLAIAKAMVDDAGVELVAFCARHVEDIADAEDVAQQACVTFWQSLPRFEGRSTLRSFLFGIALNLCRRAVRAGVREARRLERHEDDIREEIHPEALPAVDAARERRERIAALERTLAKMAAHEAWLLRARLVEELSYAEILPRYNARFGTDIQTPEGLRTAFFRARSRLEALLGEV
ncbi:MAG: RNA polymerase sigma factor [Deltaproteobacteria bacterium]|nr:RNA polymerase sigma factor [Deltaproteobacteria bacterium]